MVKRMFFKTMCHILPKKARRAIFLVSIYLKLSLLKVKDVTELKDFNNTLHIVDDLLALRLPLMFNRLFWRENNLSIRTMDKGKRDYTDQEINLMALRFVATTAMCPRTDEETDRLRKDVFNVIKYVIEKHNGGIPLCDAQ